MDICFTGKGNADDIKKHELEKTNYPPSIPATIRSSLEIIDQGPYTDTKITKQNHSNGLSTLEVCYSKWQVFQWELGAWADSTFGADRPPERSFSHLQEEVQELIADPYDLKEYADCFILLIDSARRAGYDMETILKACNDKLEINKKRKWGTPDASGKV